MHNQRQVLRSNWLFVVVVLFRIKEIFNSKLSLGLQHYSGLLLKIQDICLFSLLRDDAFTHSQYSLEGLPFPPGKNLGSSVHFLPLNSQSTLDVASPLLLLLEVLCRCHIISHCTVLKHALHCLLVGCALSESRHWDLHHLQELT